MKPLFFLTILTASSMTLGAYTNPNTTETLTGDRTTISSYLWSD